MIPPFDIFRVASDGHLVWKATADNLDSAERRVKLLMGVDPGDYIIYSQQTGNKTLVQPQKPA